MVLYTLNIDCGLTTRLVCAIENTVIRNSIFTMQIFDEILIQCCSLFKAASLA